MQIQIAVARPLQRYLDIARTERLTIWAHNRGWSGGIDPGCATQNRNGENDCSDDQTDMAFFLCAAALGVDPRSLGPWLAATEALAERAAAEEAVERRLVVVVSVPSGPFKEVALGVCGLVPLLGYGGVGSVA